MITNCSVSSGVIARILPIVIVWTDTAIGLSETMNSPNPKNPVKIIPIITSDLRPERLDKNNIEPAAKPPAINAPKANGRPSI